MRRTVREFLNDFSLGKFVNKDTETQIEAGWFDWFCEDKQLAKKTVQLANRLIEVVGCDQGKRIDIDNNYVFFKNNCPLGVALYDSMSICDCESGKVIFWIVPRESDSKKASVYWAKMGFKEAVVEGKWEDVLAWFRKGDENA